MAGARASRSLDCSRYPPCPLPHPRLQARHVNNAVRKVGVLVNNVVETLIGRHDGILHLHCERQVETIVGRVIEICRQTRRGSGKLAHGNRNCDLGAAFSTSTASAKSAFAMSPRRHMTQSALAASAKSSSGATSVNSRSKRLERLIREGLGDQPFDRHAGVNDIAGHAVSRSRSRRMISLLSAEERSRRRRGLGAGREIFFSLEERVAEDFSVLGLGRAAVRRGPLLERANDLSADTSNGQLSHRPCMQNIAFIACNLCACRGSIRNRGALQPRSATGPD